MKIWIKNIIAIAVVLVLGAIPVTTFYMAWSWCMDQVPVAHEWAGLIKVGITILCLPVGCGITIAATFLLIGIGATIAAALLD